MERKLATIRMITAVEDIPQADKIQLARIDGWQSVIKKDEYKVGDTVIFIEIDSILPRVWWAEFLADKKDPSKPIRLKTCKLRGTVSQGIIIPLTAVDGAMAHDLLVPGTDVTDILGITKYEPAIPANMAGKVRGNFPTHIFPKTDSERLQNLWTPKFLDEIHGVRFMVRFKEDGTSFSTFTKDGENGVCSRNLQLEITDEGNVYVQMYKKYDLANIFSELGLNVAIQAEIIGPGIQKNSSGVSEKQIRVFDVYDIDTREYLDEDLLHIFCKTAKLPEVTTLTNDFVFDKNIHTLDFFLKMTEQKYPGTNTQIEGLVFTPVMERYSPTLQGRLRFKVINPNYLLANE